MSTDYSIIIPAYNEETLLAQTLSSLKEAMTANPLVGELIVADNNSTDRTADIARSAGATVVFEPVNQISRARNAGARAAVGRYLVFVDADTIIPPALLQKALENLETGRCCGGGATVASATSINFMAKAVLGYWNFISRMFKLAAGCFVYVRNDDFKASGGFSEKVYATEEIWFSIALKRHAREFKRKFIIINKPKAITSARKLVWYKHSHHALLMIIACLFPVFTRFKWACGFWYKRPEK